jgi:hypothetical protein
VLNIHGVYDVRQVDIHTAEVEIAIGNLKSYKSSGTDHIPAELIKEGDEKIRSEIHKFICSICSKEEFPQQ